MFANKLIMLQFNFTCYIVQFSHRDYNQLELKLLWKMLVLELNLNLNDYPV